MLFLLSLTLHGAEPTLAPQWKSSRITGAETVQIIRGTGDRNNPIRRALAQPFAGDTLFVRFRLRYDAASIDTPDKANGEFFVLWLDAVEGADNATHSNHIPNLGVHVAGGENRFMARYHAAGQQFSNTALKGDREYLVVGRLSKSKPGAQAPFDSLSLWTDPLPGEETKPHAHARSPNAPANVRWIGFSTGRKTESTDRIQVSDLAIHTTWRGILELPEIAANKPVHPPVTPPTAKRTVHFQKDIFPILKEHCFDCHQGTKAKGGVRLDVLDEVLNQTAPRNADASLLIQMITAKDPDDRMPPPGKGDPLSTEAVAKLRAWIDEGLDWNETLLPTPQPETDHWAFQPVRRPPVPSVKNADWVRTPVDAFIARRHEQLGLHPAPPATDQTLERRLALVLTGLPPSGLVMPKMDFNGPIGKWYDLLADHWLASPEYGERWGRHWLDVARWAESNGHQHNRDRPHAWRYRDYVIRSFQQDKPFDQFLREQIAGDELPYSDDALIATGFLAAARYSGNELDKAIQRNDILVDVANTTAKAFLGLTLECAQCHTHKFDPITLRDYYRLQSFFAQGQPNNIALAGDDPVAQKQIAEKQVLFDTVHHRLVQTKRRQGVPEPILVTPKTVINGMRPEERQRYNALNTALNKLPQTWAFYSPVTSGKNLPVIPHEMRWPLPNEISALATVKTHLLVRGDVKTPGPEVTPAWPAVFGPTPAPGDQPRKALADWLTQPKHPLTARVWVNRIWQWHFGRGLVASSGDFGTQGTAPSHPELLDWLASELIANRWSTRHIHRLILRSNTWRQASAPHAANAKLDPANHTLWHWKPRRLEAEAIRDGVLAIAGRLDRQRGGPSVPRAQTETSRRRSVYLLQKRDNLPHQHILFDGDRAVVSCARRRVSTVPLQPLYLLNSQFMQLNAKAFAARLPKGKADTQIRSAFQLALARDPAPEEFGPAKKLYDQHGLESLCLVLFNLNEFLYVP